MIESHTTCQTPLSQETQLRDRELIELWMRNHTVSENRSRRQAKIKIDINHSPASATTYLLWDKVHLGTVPWIVQATLVVAL